MSEIVPRPLAGRRILVTRAEEKGSRFARLLEERGAEVLQVPLIRLEDPDSWEPLDGALARLSTFHHLLFTSAHAVDRFFERLRRKGAAGKLPDKLSVTAVGPRTAQAVARWGQGVHRVAESFRAEGILDGLSEVELTGREILLPRAQEARQLLVEELTRRGARVTVVAVYRNMLVEESRQPLLKALRGGSVDVVTFASASAVRHFVQLAGAAEVPSLTRDVKVACLGEVTADEARTLGLDPQIVAARSTLEDLAEAIAEHYRRPSPSR